MEQVLDTYELPPDPQVPVIAMDEAAKQVTGDVVPPLPMQPGRPARYDPHYERLGTQAVFLFTDPHRGWRRVRRIGAV